MPKFALITPEGNISQVDINDYRDLQAHVDGIITGFPVTSGIMPDDVSAYANDEGLLIGLPFNPIATIALYPDGLVGPVLIGGPVDDEGEETPIRDEDYKRLLAIKKSIDGF